MGVETPAVSVLASVVIAEGTTVRTRTDLDDRELYVVFDGDPGTFDLTMTRDVAAACVAQFTAALADPGSR
ncbi:hypothetical protein AB0I60_29665 [Actinosynnema sp. NPDC050436]|uniref:hypothetical protein n=1 Tax=Actinosynnema sp. NPDC050436 TaxID=3155659 RepID=UPI0033D99915